MIVNVASECGFTPQYAQLQELYDQHRDRLVVIGCPCNDFGHQEPGSAADIQQFCSINFGVSFPLTEKLTIKNNPHPLFHYLCNKSENGSKKDVEVQWNFYKFLLNENGQLEKVYPSTIAPTDSRITDWISS